MLPAQHPSNPSRVGLARKRGLLVHVGLVAGPTSQNSRIEPAPSTRRVLVLALVAGLLTWPHLLAPIALAVLPIVIVAIVIGRLIGPLGILLVAIGRGARTRPPKLRSVDINTIPVNDGQRVRNIEFAGHDPGFEVGDTIRWIGGRRRGTARPIAIGNVTRSVRALRSGVIRSITIWSLVILIAIAVLG